MNRAVRGYMAIAWVIIAIAIARTFDYSPTFQSMCVYLMAWVNAFWCAYTLIPRKED